MPLISNSTYKSPFWLRNAHLATIIPSIFRKVEGVDYVRERIITADDDFIDLDWLKNDSKKLLLLAHGLEGDSKRHYMKGPAKYFSDKGWDVVAWNCRSCNGEINRQPRLYHHADTEDLDTILKHINENNNYNEIVLAGFSMGGSIILKYLGEERQKVNNIIKAVTFSVPCDLKDSALTLSKKGRGFYRKKFLDKLKLKMKQKASIYPDKFNMEGIDDIKHFPEFEEQFTAPIHGFENADDFYKKASAKYYLNGIEIPTLIVNAINDPFFSEACYPYDEVEKLEYVFLETPRRGGHVGFMLSKKECWMEKRMFDFVESNP